MYVHICAYAQIREALASNDTHKIGRISKRKEPVTKFVKNKLLNFLRITEMAITEGGS